MQPPQQLHLLSAAPVPRLPAATASAAQVLRVIRAGRYKPGVEQRPSAVEEVEVEQQRQQPVPPAPCCP